MTAMVLLSTWMESQVEFWRPIEGFEGYDVSSWGRVRSFRRGQPRIRKQGKHRLGYREVNIWRNGRVSVQKVHRLVARAFIANPDSKPEVNHLTALKSDNRADGLEWSTRKLNIQHSFAHGLVARGNGQRHSQAILTDKQAMEIFQRVHAGERGVDLAVEFKVTKSTISGIKTGRSWNYQNG